MGLVGGGVSLTMIFWCKQKHNCKLFSSNLFHDSFYSQIETNRNTALTLACFQGRHEVVALLLDRKANVEHRAKVYVYSLFLYSQFAPLMTNLENLQHKCVFQTFSSVILSTKLLIDNFLVKSLIEMFGKACFICEVLFHIYV